MIDNYQPTIKALYHNDDPLPTYEYSSDLGGYLYSHFINIDNYDNIQLRRSEYKRGYPCDMFEDDDGNDRRAADRNHHLKEILDIPRSVHLGRIVQLIRNLCEILPQQVDVEDRRDRGENEALEGIPHAPVRNGDEICNDYELIRDHHQR